MNREDAVAYLRACSQPRRRGPAASRASRAMVRNRIQAATADADAAWPRTPPGI